MLRIETRYNSRQIWSIRGHTDDGPAKSKETHSQTAKARRVVKPSGAKAAERRLLAAMQESPGSSVVALAHAVGAGRSITGERLRRLAMQGAIESDVLRG